LIGWAVVPQRLSRRTFLKGAGVGLAGTALGAFGFGGVEAADADAIPPAKAAR
jgi:formate dehydrogenase major subunit